MMGIHNVGDLSLGQWTAIAAGWAKMNGQDKAEAPTEDDFDLAVMRARRSPTSH